jgi:hypothetical protein
MISRALIDATLRGHEELCRQFQAPLWDDRPDVPVCLVSSPTAEEDRAAVAADEARRRVEDKINRLYEHRAARSPRCERGRVLHLHRDRGVRDYQRGEEARGRSIPYKTAAKECCGNGDTEHALVRMSCGRSDCPHCFRRRLVKSYRRAVHCLLYADADSNRPRVGVLHVAETDPLNWDTLDRNMRRKHGGKTGRIRVRQANGRVLVVAERPFPGARLVPPAEALDLVSAAIDQLHTARHSLRLLGNWNDARRPHWRLLQRVEQPADQPPLDFEAIVRELRAGGRKVRRFRSPEISGLVWAGDGNLSAVCPTLAKKKEAPPRPKSDKGGVIPEEWANPAYDVGGGGSQWT